MKLLFPWFEPLAKSQVRLLREVWCMHRQHPWLRLGWYDHLLVSRHAEHMEKGQFDFTEKPGIEKINWSDYDLCCEYVVQLCTEGRCPGLLLLLLQLNLDLFDLHVSKFVVKQPASEAHTTGRYNYELLLMEEILHQLIGSLFQYLQGFLHPRWCRISSINSMYIWIMWMNYLLHHLRPTIKVCQRLCLGHQHRSRKWRHVTPNPLHLGSCPGSFGGRDTIN